MAQSRIMPFSRRATNDTATYPTMPARKRACATASEASDRAAGGTDCWGKDDPMAW